MSAGVKEEQGARCEGREGEKKPPPTAHTHTHTCRLVHILLSYTITARTPTGPLLRARRGCRPRGRWWGGGGCCVGAVRVPEISPLPYNNDFLALYHNNSPWKIPRLAYNAFGPVNLNFGGYIRRRRRRRQQNDGEGMVVRRRRHRIL